MGEADGFNQRRNGEFPGKKKKKKVATEKLKSSPRKKKINLQCAEPVYPKDAMLNVLFPSTAYPQPKTQLFIVGSAALTNKMRRTRRLLPRTATCLVEPAFPPFVWYLR